MRTTKDDLTCIHAPHGLCELCRAAYDEDPAAYLEFGDHPEGLRRWREEQEAMRAWQEANPPQPLRVDDEVPF